jgi:hypothetical protein
MVCGLLGSGICAAQDRPYFVTYDDDLEKKGDAELSVLTTAGNPHDASGYAAPWMEIEYGITSRWTAELYLEGVHISGGSAFTGWRIENRVRPFAPELPVNLILYVEYENTSEASRIQKEIVGSGKLPQDSLGALLAEHTHELEGRIILSSDIGEWNVSENFIAEKNVSQNEGVEFGYSVGVSRPLRAAPATAKTCAFCSHAFILGVEAYGGLGSTQSMSLHDTRHFVAPLLGWQLTGRSRLRASIGFGVSSASDPYLVRVGYDVDLW